MADSKAMAKLVLKIFFLILLYDTIEGTTMPPQDQSPPPAPIPQTEAPPPAIPPVAPVAPAPVAPAPTPVAPPPVAPKRGKGGLFLVLLLLIVGIGVVVALLIPRLKGVAGPVELTWWGLWEDQAIVAPLIAQYQQAHPNVKITYVNQAKEDYRERLTSALARGQGPDIFRIHNTWVPMFQKDLDVLPSSVMTASDYAKTFYPVTVSDMAKESSYVGMPLGFDTLALFINEEIFDTYGKQPPTTWDELRSLARELTIKEGQSIRQAGVALGRTENVDHWSEILTLLMMQNGVKMTSPNGELAEAALEFYTRFWKQDGVWDQSLPSSTVAFAGGKLAMYFGNSWRVHEIRQMNPNLRFRIVKLPQLPKERADEPSIYFSSYWVESVWAESKNKTEAWEFLKFMTSKESLQKFYQNASQARGFGEPYPRIDMQELLLNDPVVGTFVAQGKEAKSWYAVTRTFDGPTGINSQTVKYLEDAVNGVNIRGNSVKEALNTAAQGITQVLAQYGLVKAPPPQE